MAIFDSDVLIDILRDVQGASEAIDSFEKEQNYVSAITFGEILFGMREEERTDTFRLLSGFKVISTDAETIMLAAAVKNRAKGHKLDLYDCIIAATAIKHSQVLVTRNSRHYPDKSLRLFVPKY